MCLVALCKCYAFVFIYPKVVTVIIEKKSAILKQYTTHLGCHKGKRVNASVEVADRNADGQQAEAAHVNTKQQKQNLAVRQQWRGRRK